jgi:hypothetical protein
MLLFFCHVSAQSEWHLKKEEEGVKVYIGNSGKPGIISVKSEATISSSLSCITSIIKEVYQYTSWVYKCERAEIVKETGTNEFIYYQLNNAPWPIKSRDMVVHLKIENTEKQLIISSESIEGIIPRKSGIVRIKNFNSDWTITMIDDTHALVINVISLDPGGGISSGLAKKFVIEGPYNTMRNFKKLATDTSCVHLPVKSVH